jgi:membrane protein
MNVHSAWTMLRQTFTEWSEDRAPQLGAALAFYTAISIAPLLVISLAIASLFFGEEAARGEVQNQMQSMVGDQGAQAVEEMITNASKPETGTLAAILGVLTLLFGASGVFGELQQSLNIIWDVERRPGRGIWGAIKDRFFSIVMVFGIAFLLLVSLVLSAALTAMGTLTDQLPDSLHWLGQGLHLGASFILITLLFAMLFKYVPDVKIAWRDVWLGAVVTAALFTVGKFAIGLYLGHSSMASSYGLAGSFVVLLVWVYYSAQILFFGAELTQVYANRYGSRIVPAENAQLADEKSADKPSRPSMKRAV